MNFCMSSIFIMNNHIIHIVFKDNSEMIINEANSDVTLITKSGDILNTNIEHNLYSYFSLAQDNKELFNILSHGKSIIELYCNVQKRIENHIEIRATSKSSMNYYSNTNYQSVTKDASNNIMRSKNLKPIQSDYKKYLKSNPKLPDHRYHSRKSTIYTTNAKDRMITSPKVSKQDESKIKCTLSHLYSSKLNHLQLRNRPISGTNQSGLEKCRKSQNNSNAKASYDIKARSKFIIKLASKQQTLINS